MSSEGSVEIIPKERIKNDIKMTENQEEIHENVGSQDMYDDNTTETEDVQHEDKGIDGVKDTEDQKDPGLKYMTVLVRKTYKPDEEDEQGELESQTAQHAEKIVQKWIKRKDIIGVQDITEEDLITDGEELSNYNLWLSEVRTVGKHTLRLEVFFVVVTAKGLKDLVAPDRMEYKRNNIWVE